MKTSLDETRETDDGYNIAWIHHSMREIGLPQQITEEDRKKMKYGLVRARKEASWEMAWMHYHMRELGLPQQITEEDRKKMKDGLEEAREENDGWDIAEMHNIIRKILPPPEEKQTNPIPPIKKYQR